MVFNNRVVPVFMSQMTNLPGQSIVAILQSLHNAYIMLYSIYYNIYNTILCCSIIKYTITTAFLKLGTSAFLGRMQIQETRYKMR